MGLYFIQKSLFYFKCFTNVKWPSHISVWALRMPAYDDFLSFVVIRWCTSAARREVVERAFRARCHTHSYVGARCVRREIFCMHKNSLRMPTYGPYAASTLCTRNANVPRVRGTVGVCWRNVHSTLTLLDTFWTQNVSISRRALYVLVASSERSVSVRSACFQHTLTV